MTTTPIPPARAFDLALQGLRRADNTVAAAVDAIVKVQIAANNSVANTDTPVPQDAVQVSDEAIVAAANQAAVVDSADVGTNRDIPTDIAQPLVDLEQAKVAYLASLKAVQVTGDIQSDLAKLRKLI